MSSFRLPLEHAFRHALEHLNGLDRRPVDATATLEELRARFVRPLAQTGVAAEEVVSDLLRDVEGGVIGSAGGRFFGWVIGGAVPSSLAADWLASTWDQAAGLYAAGPAAAVVEEVAGAWLKDLLGLPDSASFAFVTGCQMAHATCLAAARHALLARRGWDVEQQGLWGAPPITIFSSTEYHGTVDRAVRLLGFGRVAVTKLPIDTAGRLNPQALEAALEANGGAPAVVLLQAGDLNIGAYDDFEELIPIAHRHSAWVHVDGAFGLWAAASPRFSHLVRGVAAADSWATDGHKWLNVPYDSGYAFVANPAPHRAAMSHRASYLTYDEAARDELDWTPEWSRRARGFPTYAALRELGRSGVASLVERCCDLARALVLGIGGLPGAEVVWEPTINQGLVRFGDERRTDAVIAAILRTGEAFFGGTTWRGKRCMRISVCNWQTCERDVERAIRAAGMALQEMGPPAS
jgi:glutamate/tyrosine decarboxylase-like PLP-dependent enzyme